MKLIRLTSENGSGIFDCNFNDGIRIKENSSVALQSLSANLAGGNLTIDNDNNGLTYQIKDAYLRQINLRNFEYNPSNADQLLDDITDKLNNDARWEAGLNKIIGLEWKVHKDPAQGANVNIAYRVQPIAEYNATFEFNNVFRATTNNGTWGKTDGLSGGLDFTTCALVNSELSKGNGVWRCRIGRLGNGGDINTSGFYWGLTKDPVDPDQFEERNLNFAIYATNNGGVLQYYTVLDGVRTLNATTPTTPVNPPNAGYLDNDFLEATIDGNKVKLNVYQGAAATKTTLAEYNYNNEALYPCMVFIGNRANATVNQVRWTPSPWLDTALTAPPTDIHDGGLARPPTPSVPKPLTNNLVIFESSQVAAYLGYDFRRIPAAGFETATDELDLVASQTFTVGLDVNSFLVQFLNLNVDSYDSLREQRENILAVVPNTNLNGELDYSPPYPVFLDLMNEEPLTIRNIKARIVNNDYSGIEMLGQAEINIIIQ
jgi:hypothetical protein